MGVDILNPLINRLAGGECRIRAQGLRGSSRAYLLSRVVSRLNRPLVVLTPGMAEAREFASELRFFLGADPPGAMPWDKKIVLLPPWDSLPFEVLPPHPEISGQRVAALLRAMHGGPFVLVAPIEAAFRLLPPPKAIDKATLTISVGEEVGRDELLRRLADAGYRRSPEVEERGEMSLRGGIMDLYAPHYAEPIRVEFFGDEVESLRFFDPSTQRSTGRLDEAVLLPAREVIGGEKEASQGMEKLRKRCHQLGFNLTQTSEALETLKLSAHAPMRECFLAYFYERAATLWDYLPKNAPVVLDLVDDVATYLENFLEDNKRGHDRAADSGRLVPRLEEIWCEPAHWVSELKKRPILELDELAREERNQEAFPYSTTANEDLASVLKRSRGSEHLLMPLADLIRKDRGDGNQVYLVCHSKGSAQRIKDLLFEYGFDLAEREGFVEPDPAEVGRIGIFLGELERGFRFPARRLTLITESEIFGRKARRAAPKRGGFRQNLSDLTEGGYIVHNDFGIGRFKGMVRLKVEGDEGDYLHLEYAEGGRLYLPVTRLNLISPYTAGADSEVRLDRIGGKSWEKARKKAAEGIEKMAHELLDLYARREVANRPFYPEQGLAYREFEATFPFEETRDQLSAIEQVMEDMSKDKPMDRLICGDVGYGKTEVAIRAAFRAVEGGRQVALLAPTTVLAAQHYQSFQRRFEGYPVTVEMLSRFVDKPAQKEACARIAKGAADVVVGTHALLGSNLKFKNLGLMVIDEEHRFGVAQKEKLKKFRNAVDVLTLSATPIPRTLQLGLTGARDLSVIETPPADRLAVRTRVARFDDEVIREAVARELNRGGQVFFVHNRVNSIMEIAARLKETIPGIKLGVGHGQMHEDELRRVMDAFSTGEIDLLLCTAIIESGLDIPRANTILIDRADTFGLADLYQLRGRVGRSNLQAYCYLLVPEERDMTGDAKKRLAALMQFTELGAGFKVAIHDLEIRGAGEFLGKNQSGHIAAIGFDMYSDLLNDAVRKLKGEPFGRPPEPDIRLKIPAHFPEDYVEDPRLRLELYERLTNRESAAEIDEMGYELIDRFGPVPHPVKNLMEIMKLRLSLLSIRATGLDYAGERLTVAFDENPAIDAGAILSLATRYPNRCRITPDNKLQWTVGKLDEDALLEEARQLLSNLANL